MKLNMDALKQAAALREKGYRLPEYDVEALRRRTAEKPQWVHFGPGNIFRAHIARAHQELLNQGGFDTGIIAYAAAPARLAHPSGETYKALVAGYWKGR